MGSGQCKFIHERIKSCGFYTIMTMINKWVMGHGQWQFKHERINTWGFYTNVPMIKKWVMGGNSYMKESKDEVFTQIWQRSTQRSNGQWQFIHERIKRWGFYTNITRSTNE